MEETLVVFEHVLLHVFPKMQAKELLQVVSSVLQFEEVWFQQLQTVLSLSAENPSETVATASDQSCFSTPSAQNE